MMTTDKDRSQEQEKQEQEKEQNDKINYERDCFLSAMNPFGGGDVRSMIETAIGAGKDGDWCADQINEYLDSCGGKLGDIDPCAVVYDSLLQEARNEIDNLTGKDIQNDLSPCIEVYGNYLCTQLDGKEEAVKNTLKIIKRIRIDDRTEAILWLKERLENMY